MDVTDWVLGEHFIACQGAFALRAGDAGWLVLAHGLAPENTRGVGPGQAQRPAPACLEDEHRVPGTRPQSGGCLQQSPGKALLQKTRGAESTPCPLPGQAVDPVGGSRASLGGNSFPPRTWEIAGAPLVTSSCP